MLWSKDFIYFSNENTSLMGNETAYLSLKHNWVSKVCLHATGFL